MKNTYISSFSVNFREYGLLNDMVSFCSDLNTGIEYATSWNYPEFDALLDKEIEQTKAANVTIHAPFVEICGAPGSGERREMDRMFAKAFRWYALFGARSMVMHTHEKQVTPENKRQLMDYAEQAVIHVYEEAKARGVKLTVENVGFGAAGNVLFTQDEYTALFSRLPGEIGALVDIGHAMANHWDLFGLIEKLNGRITAYHLHNTDGIHDLHRPMYEPGLWYSAEKMDDLMRCVKAASPYAELIFEYAPGRHITKELMRRDIERVLRIVE